MQNMQTQDSYTIQTRSGEAIRLDPATVKKFLVNGNGKVTDQEVVLFIGLCKAQGLNPFNKEVYLMKYGEQPATFVTSKDVFLNRAIQNTKYRGMRSGIVVLNKEGEMIEREGTICVKGEETLLGAWAEVNREGWDIPTKVTVSFDEYVGTKKNGEINSQWQKRPGFMIQKVAESQALRKTFTDEMKGLYTEEEMDVNVDNVVATIEPTEKIEAQKLKEKFVETNSQEVTEGNDLF